jgi:hypothetical protein
MVVIENTYFDNLTSTAHKLLGFQSYAKHLVGFHF